jgi:hypothetical protein
MGRTTALKRRDGKCKKITISKTKANKILLMRVTHRQHCKNEINIT